MLQCLDILWRFLPLCVRIARGSIRECKRSWAMRRSSSRPLAEVSRLRCCGCPALKSLPRCSLPALSTAYYEYLYFEYLYFEYQYGVCARKKLSRAQPHTRKNVCAQAWTGKNARAHLLTTWHRSLCTVRLVCHSSTSPIGWAPGRLSRPGKLIT